MIKIRLLFLVFCGFLGLVIYTADMGSGARYWGWLNRVPMGDKIGHFGFMSTLCLLSNLALGCRQGRVGRYRVRLATVLVIIFVVGEEISQFWIPTRSFDLMDLAADFIGITGGDWAAWRLDACHRIAQAVDHV